MRVIILILALLGAAAFRYFRFDHHHNPIPGANFQEHMKRNPEGANKCVYMIYSLMGAPVLAVLGGAFAFKRKRLVAAPLLLLAGAIPLGLTWLASQTGILVDTVLMFVGVA